MLNLHRQLLVELFILTASAARAYADVEVPCRPRMLHPERPTGAYCPGACCRSPARRVLGPGAQPVASITCLRGIAVGALRLSCIHSLPAGACRSLRRSVSADTEVANNITVRSKPGTLYDVIAALTSSLPPIKMHFRRMLNAMMSACSSSSVRRAVMEARLVLRPGLERAARAC